MHVVSPTTTPRHTYATLPHGGAHVNSEPFARPVHYPSFFPPRTSLNRLCTSCSQTRNRGAAKSSGSSTRARGWYPACTTLPFHLISTRYCLLAEVYWQHTLPTLIVLPLNFQQKKDWNSRVTRSHRVCGGLLACWAGAGPLLSG